MSISVSLSISASIFISSIYLHLPINSFISSVYPTKLKEYALHNSLARKSRNSFSYPVLFTEDTSCSKQWKCQGNCWQVKKKKKNLHSEGKKHGHYKLTNIPERHYLLMFTRFWHVFGLFHILFQCCSYCFYFLSTLFLHHCLFILFY